MNMEHRPLQVVTSIKPLALIAKAALGKRADVAYLQPANKPSHSFNLSLSDIDRLDQADLIILVGDDFEPNINKIVQKIASHKTLKLIDVVRKATPKHLLLGGQQFRIDPHVWLNPRHANSLANAIQGSVGVSAQDIISQAEIKKLAEELKSVSQYAFISHHDVLGHFTEAFQLSTGNSIRDGAGNQKGAKSQYKLRKDTSKGQAYCVFVEPQYADKDAAVMAKALNLPIVMLDPLGAAQPLNKSGYRKFIDTLVMQFKACFV
ncbi:MAG: zinc ABC transporter substrate-binding protein [Porticoccaceae bacterium]|nr:zinc ABC transporter substrate-binding protein [Porticoccaceae bacterium]